MIEFEAGMLVRSKAGHDSGKVYVIIRAEDEYIYLSDGNIRTLDKLKKKKKKHVQVIHKVVDMHKITDVYIKKELKEYCKEEAVIKEGK